MCIYAGAFPVSLSHLVSLRHLVLHENKFTGKCCRIILVSVPSFISRFIDTIGTFPSDLALLSSLESLDVQLNKIEGTLFSLICLIMPYIVATGPYLCVPSLCRHAAFLYWGHHDIITSAAGK